MVNFSERGLRLALLEGEHAEEHRILQLRTRNAQVSKRQYQNHMSQLNECLSRIQKIEEEMSSILNEVKYAKTNSY